MINTIVTTNAPTVESVIVMMKGLVRALLDVSEVWLIFESGSVGDTDESEPDEATDDETEEEESACEVEDAESEV